MHQWQSTSNQSTKELNTNNKNSRNVQSTRNLPNSLYPEKMAMGIKNKNTIEPCPTAD